MRKLLIVNTIQFALTLLLYRHTLLCYRYTLFCIFVNVFNLKTV